MDLKKLLKTIKLNESTISMILGVIVIVITGYFLINLFKDENGEIIPPVGIEEEQVGIGGTHVVKKGEDLWKIAENYYQDGYKWVEIAEANNLEEPYVITENQKLIIPNLNDKIASDDLSQDSMEETVEVEPTSFDEPEEPTSTSTPMPTEPVPTEEIMAEQPEYTEDVMETGNKGDETVSNENVYVVQHGDSLWKIAQAQYGDPYKWVDIAKANNLENPSIIHAGNEFVIPR